jgi:site-specific DNA-methyltransferase (adenine-specific)
VLHKGDCLEVVRTMPDNSIDSVCTDPPYALVSIVKRFGADGAAPAKAGTVYARASSGFMQKAWDVGDVAFSPDFWSEICRVLKPGGYVAAFGGDRTFHRLFCAIEDAGLQPRHTIGWLFGTGFPKNHSINKALSDVEWCDCDE